MKIPSYALIMLTLVYAFNYIDRQILVILQESIKLDMGLSDTQLGLLSGFSFALVYVTAGLPIAYLADRTSRRNIIGVALTVWSGMTALSGLAQNYTQLLLARIGVGLGEAGGSPPAHSMISDYYPPEKRGTALSFYSTGLYVGIFAGYLLGGFISDALGWRMAFLAVGIPGVLFALVFALTVKEPLRGRWENSDSAQLKPTLSETLNWLMSIRSFWWVALGTGLTAFGGYGTANFGPSFLMRSHGMSVTEVSVYLALIGGVSGVLGTFLGGYLADRWGVKDMRWYVWVPALGGLLTLPPSILYFLSDSVFVVMVMMFISGVLYPTYLGPSIAVSHALVPPAMRALSSAILFFVLNLIGLGLGPLSAGIFSDLLADSLGSDSLRYSMVLVSLIGASGALCFYLAGRSLKSDLARQLPETSAARLHTSPA